MTRYSLEFCFLLIILILSLSSACVGDPVHPPAMVLSGDLTPVSGVPLPVPTPDGAGASITGTVAPVPVTIKAPRVFGEDGERGVIRSAPIIADHRIARLWTLKRIPKAYFWKARKNLRIFYAHTSHGSQITSGMSGLATFRGAPQPSSQFRWNNAGTNGALRLSDHDGDYGDLGSNGDLTWAQHTRDYLNAHPGINVVMWSWCGGVSESTAADINQYLNEMNRLEAEYPRVTFVYMTGHLDGTGVYGNLNQRNNQIRSYCRTNNKVLFDFADIESYNPKNVCFLNRRADDACNWVYQGSTRNWAKAWQNTHRKGVAWYDCPSAHSEPLNANLKAYAAWWLWARLAGWNGTLTS